jgi:hypothetical protein
MSIWTRQHKIITFNLLVVTTGEASIVISDVENENGYGRILF